MRNRLKDVREEAARDRLISKKQAEVYELRKREWYDEFMAKYNAQIMTVLDQLSDDFKS